MQVGQKVKDKRDGVEYVVVNLRPCGKDADCEYAGCQKVKDGITITMKIKKEFLELLQ
jgi:hypothetical protein